MIASPGIIALLLCSTLSTFILLYGARHGWRILRKWDLKSGSELQLDLEHRTYLVSSIVGILLAFQLLSLILFVYTADSVCSLLIGAMCAVGTLGANPFGYPTLLLKLANFLFSGTWLIINRADNLGYDYPLIRPKYCLLLLMAPLTLSETVLQWLFFSHLKPDIITSCCGSLFGSATGNLASEMAALPPLPTLAVFYFIIILTLGAGIRLVLTGQGGLSFTLLSATNLLTALATIVSTVSLYVYELPTHHCPFCLLKPEYHYLGYLLYLSLLAATVTGIGAGLLGRWRNIPSLVVPLISFQRRLALCSACANSFLLVMVTLAVLTSNLKLS